MWNVKNSDRRHDLFHPWALLFLAGLPGAQWVRSVYKDEFIRILREAKKIFFFFFILNSMRRRIARAGGIVLLRFCTAGLVRRLDWVRFAVGTTICVY